MDGSGEQPRGGGDLGTDALGQWGQEEARTGRGVGARWLLAGVQPPAPAQVGACPDLPPDREGASRGRAVPASTPPTLASSFRRGHKLGADHEDRSRAAAGVSGESRAGAGPGPSEGPGGLSAPSSTYRFIQDRAGRVAGGAPELLLDSMGDSAPLPSDPRTKRLTECLRRIGDELDSNMELQRMIAAVETDSPREVFFRVAAEMFSDGNFNWGRVVALFYFASKLVLKALCTKVPELIRTIVGWTLDFLRERLLTWIQEQGGWDGLLSYFGTPTWQTVTIFVAGILTASLTIWKMS
uniref:Apoptosis regulator BAX n=1 Tax=Monodelphis domestica TaxID=13616 RepID=A0A5F8GMP1_MONDO